jgi:hypothetical protein
MSLVMPSEAETPLSFERATESEGATASSVIVRVKVAVRLPESVAVMLNVVDAPERLRFEKVKLPLPSAVTLALVFDRTTVAPGLVTPTRVTVALLVR